MEITFVDAARTRWLLADCNYNIVQMDCNGFEELISNSIR